MGVLGSLAGRVARRYGSKLALVVGSLISAVAFAYLALRHAHPYDMLISSALLGVGIGLAFSALGNLIVQAVPPYQTGVASGMNTVMRTLGGALGGQIAATLIAGHTVERPADGDWVHRDVLDGHRVPDRLRARGDAGPGTLARAGGRRSGRVRGGRRGRRGLAS